MNKDKVKRAITWIEREINYIKNAPRINGCEMTDEWQEELDVMETALIALKEYSNADTGE